MKCFTKTTIFTAFFALAIGCGGPLDQASFDDDPSAWDGVLAEDSEALTGAGAANSSASGSDPFTTPSTEPTPIIRGTKIGNFYVSPKGANKDDWWIVLWKVDGRDKEKIEDGFTWMNRGGDNGTWWGQLNADLSDEYRVEVHTEAGMVSSASVSQW